MHVLLMGYSFPVLSMNTCARRAA